MSLFIIPVASSFVPAKVRTWSLLLRQESGGLQFVLDTLFRHPRAPFDKLRVDWEIPPIR